MFVISVSKNKLKNKILIGAVVAFISLALVFLLKYIGGFQSVETGGEISRSVSNNEEILTFISGYGWEVDEEPIEVREVVIPEVFDEVYDNYNAIQLKQGFDLTEFAGQRVKRWTYVIRNYPDTASDDGFIRINLLINDGVVIGGDVCSVKLDGFMHGFSKE